jgi:D-alanyl-D-alanine carboxypeptidase
MSSGRTLLAGVAVLVAAALPTTPATAAANRPAHEPPFAAPLRTSLLTELQRRRIPGVVVGVHTPRYGTWTTAFGVSDIPNGTPMRTDTQLRIGSITKTFTGRVVLRLVAQGKLALDAPISRYVSGVPNGDAITLRMLLNMTSGLFSYTEDPQFLLDAAGTKRWATDELLKIAFAHDPYFAPGQGYHYSNTNTVLAGLAAEKVTGQPLRALMRKLVFVPLGMRHTLLPADGTFIPAPASRGYNYDLEAPTTDPTQTALVDWNAGTPDDVTDMDTSWGWAAGGAVSTVGDLLRWAPALGTGRQLPAALWHEQTQWVPIEGTTSGYGLGVADIDGVIGHDGRLPGFNAFVGYNPKTKVSYAIIVNLSQSPDGTTPANLLLDVMRRTLG